MTDREKVIKGLESLHRRLLDAAKRDSIATLDAIIVSDALALLKEQEPMKQNGEQYQCNRCKFYQGVHNVRGHAPCSFWNIGGVMWNDHCSRFHDFRTGGEVGMTNREKVIKGLESCQECDGYTCRNRCPYNDKNEPENQATCTCRLAHDALALLRGQQTADTISREALLRELRKIPGYRDEESEALVPLRDVCKIVMLAAAQTQIVRCRNCEYGEDTGIEWRCNKHSHSRNDNALGEDRHYIEYHHGDWFCADGERRRNN